MALTVAQANRPVIKVTGTTDVAYEVLPKTQQVRILWVYWYSPAAPDDLLLVTDADGNEIVKGICVTAKEGLWFPIDGLEFAGISISDMDSGEVLIGVVLGRKI